MSTRDVVVLGAARSAIGTFGGALADMEPCELAGLVMKEAVARSGVDPKQIPNPPTPMRGAPPSTWCKPTIQEHKQNAMHSNHCLHLCLLQVAANMCRHIQVVQRVCKLPLTL